MMTGTARFLALALMLAPISLCGGQNEEFEWPNGAKAAVNLAYDDALDSHLDIAIPTLERYGFRGSFYLVMSRESVSKRLGEWRAAASRGHELGNHTLYHQCSASEPDRGWVQPWRDLDRVPSAELVEDIRVASAFLHAIDGRTERTFTAPCGEVEAGGENYIESIMPDFLAIKAGPGGVQPAMETLDPYAVGVAAPVGVSGEELIAMVQEAAARGTMANFTFHGVGGDYLSVSAEAHEQLLQHLAAHPEIYWVDTFVNIMRYVRGRK
jgi:peptidoglycan/xylan/chitin deacetylase (PgdA/CDA1 family)